MWFSTRYRIEMSGIDIDDLLSSTDGDISEAIVDRFTSLSEVTQAMKKMGLEKCGLIFGIDYTLSNRTQGKKTFGGKSLHYISSESINPYQDVICTMGETLETFDDDGIIPVYGFGDRKTKDVGVFKLKEEGHCMGFGEVLEIYEEITPNVKLAGPTNFAPLIRKGVELVKERQKYHILIIVADGQVSSESDTIHAIVDASNHALSIVLVGVGDRPWGMMKDFDDCLPTRKFDNFQFVNYHEVKADKTNPQAAFALHALMEIPDQYKEIKRLGYLDF